MRSSKYFPSVYSSKPDALLRVRRIFKHASIERPECRSNGQDSFIFGATVRAHFLHQRSLVSSSTRSCAWVEFACSLACSNRDFLQALLFFKYDMTSCQLISHSARWLWDNVTPKLNNLLLKAFEAEEVYVDKRPVSPSFTVSLLLESVYHE